MPHLLQHRYDVLDAKGDALGVRLGRANRNCIVCEIETLIDIMRKDLEAFVLFKREPLQAGLCIPCRHHQHRHGDSKGI